MQGHCQARDIARPGTWKTIAEKAKERKLIYPETIAMAKNRDKAEVERASHLTCVLLDRVQEKRKDLRVIIEILESTNLSNVARIIDPSKYHFAASGKTAELLCQGIKFREKPSNKDAFLALMPVANEWKTIGTLLELPSAKLDSIQNENNKDLDRLREMIAEWLKTPEANWEALIEAVKPINKEKALEIQKEWCMKAPEY